MLNSVSTVRIDGDCILIERIGHGHYNPES